MTPSFNQYFFLNSRNNADPISKPKIDLADALPIPLLSTEIIITGLLNLSLILEATIPITPHANFFHL